MKLNLIESNINNGVLILFGIVMLIGLFLAFIHFHVIYNENVLIVSGVLLLVALIGPVIFQIFDNSYRVSDNTLEFKDEKVNLKRKKKTFEFDQTKLRNVSIYISGFEHKTLGDIKGIDENRGIKGLMKIPELDYKNIEEEVNNPDRKFQEDSNYIAFISKRKRFNIEIALSDQETRIAFLKFIADWKS